MIKKIIRIFVISMVVSTVTGLGSLIYMINSVVSPSLKTAGLSYKDLVVSNNVDSSKYIKLQESLNAKSNEFGKKAAQQTVKGINVLFPSKPVDLSKIPGESYNPTVDEALRLNNQSAQEGLSKGMKALDDLNNKK